MNRLVAITKEFDMKTAIYMRVSTDKQSTEMQEREISMFLASKGIINAEIYKDEGESGKKTSRPALNRLLNDCKQGNVKTLIVWKLDRLFRSLVDLITHLKQFQKQGIVFISLKENIDLSTPMGVLMMQILGAFGEFEREMIVQRVKAGLANAKAKGKQLGKPTKIPMELQQQVVTLKVSGQSYAQVSMVTGLKIPAIQRILQRHRVYKVTNNNA